MNYFPSRFDKVRNAEAYPIPKRTVHGTRTKHVITKENNFKQAGERFRSWPRAEQERFVKRMSDALNHPRLTPEHRRIWVSNWTQCDAALGAAIAKLVNVKAAM